MHSTLFGPVKYSYLPQHLGEHELVGGNGLVEMGTFVAILIGTIIGGAAAGIEGSGERVLAVSGSSSRSRGASSRSACRHAGAAARSRDQLEPVQRNLAQPRLARQNRTVFLSLLGISWLWFVGATFLTSFFNFAKDVLSASPDVVTVLLATFSVGIGLGSLLCERLSQRRVEIGLVPLGSIGISVFAIELYFASHACRRPAICCRSANSWPARALAHPGRPVPARDVRRLLQRAARADPEPQRADASRAHHRREQHPQRAVHDPVGVMAMGLTKAGVDIPGLFLVTALLNVASRRISTCSCRSSCCASSHGCWCIRSTGSASCMRSGFRRKARPCWCAITSATSMRSCWPPRARGRSAS
jgi:hypothetical protein